MYRVDFFEDGVKQTVYMTGIPEEIRVRLSKEGKVVLSISKERYLFWKGNRPKSVDIYTSLKAVSDLLNSGVRLTDALKSALNTTPSLQMKRVISAMLSTVLEGKEVSSAMDPDIFGRVIILMVKAGEKSGKLAESLNLAAMHVKTLEEIKKDMFKRISYPLIVLVVGIISLLLNTVVILPKVVDSELFQMTLKGQEGFSIEALRFISFIAPIFIVTTVIISILIYGYYRRNQEKMERYLFGVPYIREFLFYRDFFTSFLSLSMLLESGEKLDTSLEIVSGSAGFHTIRQEFERSREYLKSGGNFALGFKHITDIEKAMLGMSLNVENLRKAVELVSQRFYAQYEEKLKGLAPKIYAVVLLFTLSIFILVAMAIVIPYGRILGGLYA